MILIKLKGSKIIGGFLARECILQLIIKYQTLGSVESGKPVKSFCRGAKEIMQGKVLALHDANTG